VTPGRWNHNIEYYPVLLAAVPDACRRALDVGCGEGTLARVLRRSVPHVTGIDADEQVLELARRDGTTADITYLLGDFFTFPFEPASFDFVVSVAALHHMDATAGLTRMRELLRPGGTLAVLGMAASRYPADLPRVAAATALTRVYRRTRPHWESPARRVWPPAHTFPEARRLAEAALPRVRYRRHLLWRYSLIWNKPVA
jgi:2-polyprenyl-3-methyl-5-hydroxy-6-metoxy-1,4-benzoquinol methylase